MRIPGLREDIRAAIAYAADTVAREPVPSQRKNLTVRFAADESCDFAVVRILCLAAADPRFHPKPGLPVTG